MPKLSGKEKVIVIFYSMHFGVFFPPPPRFSNVKKKKKSFVDYLSLVNGIVGQW